MGKRFLALFVVVSGLAALAAALLVEGAGDGDGMTIAGGTIAASLAGLGIVALVRVIVAVERAARR